MALHEDQPLHHIVVDYLIDGQNRRVGRKVGGIVTHLYVWEDDLRVSAVLDATGTVLVRYVYGTRVNVPEYVVTAAGTYRLLTDHLGSVRVVVDVATGAIVQEREYDEWGRVTVVSDRFVAGDLGELQPFGFAGGLYDSLTGLVRFGVRDYDAAVGRWMAKDPIRFIGKDANLFDYSFADPINHSDRTGLFVLNAAGAIGGAIGGAVGGALFSADPISGALAGAIGGAIGGALAPTPAALFGAFAGAGLAAASGANFGGIVGAAVGGGFFGRVGSLGPGGIGSVVNAACQGINGAAASSALGSAGEELYSQATE